MERAPCTHLIGWVNPRAGQDVVEKRKFLTLPGLKLRPLSRPAIKIDLKIIDRGDGCWTELAQNRVRICTLILALLKLQIVK
jgi:hypothetical protein